MTKRIIALLMVLTMAICCTACAGKGKKEEAPKETESVAEVAEEATEETPAEEEAPAEEAPAEVKIASTETADGFSVGVPEGFEFSIGDFVDENDEKEFHIKKSDFSYFDFHAQDEELNMKNYNYNHDTYTNEQEDFEKDYNGMHWIGFQYSDGFGGNGFEAYTTIGERSLRISVVGFTYDSPEAEAILGSIAYNGEAAAEEAEETEEPAEDGEAVDSAEADEVVDSVEAEVEEAE